MTRTRQLFSINIAESENRSVDYGAERLYDFDGLQCHVYRDEAHSHDEYYCHAVDTSERLARRMKYAGHRLCRPASSVLI